MGDFASIQVTPESRAAEQAAPPSVEEIAVAERPAFIPEKFYKDGKVNIKALAESYGHLESSKTKETQQQQIQQQSQQPNSQPAKGSETQASETPAKDGEQPQPVNVPGVAPERMKAFSEEITTKGELSKESYDELAKLGYPKIVVDSYIKGITADARAQEASLAAEKIAEIKSSIGGEEVLTDMLNWASTNLSPEDLKVYNESVASRDAAKVKMAVMGLHHAYEQANGRTPNFIGGERLPNTAGVEPFKSNAEVTRAMHDPRYDKDPAYRDEVARRLAVSDVFSQSHAVKKLVRS